MRLPRLVAVTTLALSLTLAACGGSDEPEDSAGTSPSADAPADAPADDPVDEPADDPADEPAEAIDVCSLVTADEIGAIVGGAVTASEVPGGGCSFDQDDPRAPSVALGVTPYDESTGGLEGAKSGVSAVIDGTPADVDLGDGAFVVVGTTMGGDSQQGGGAVHVGGSIVQVTYLQSTGLTADEVTTQVTDLLTLVASKG